MGKENEKMEELKKRLLSILIPSIRACATTEQAATVASDILQRELSKDIQEATIDGVFSLIGEQLRKRIDVAIDGLCQAKKHLAHERLNSGHILEAFAIIDSAVSVIDGERQ